MSFKAKKTAMLVGLCCLGMISTDLNTAGFGSYHSSSFRTANEAGNWLCS